MKILPARKVVVIKPTTLPTFKVGTIEVVSEKKPEIGEVVAVGRGKPPVEGIKKGDIIAYRKYGESMFMVGTEQRLFVDFQDCLGVIRPK